MLASECIEKIRLKKLIGQKSCYFAEKILRKCRFVRSNYQWGGGGCQIITKNITRRSFKNLIKNQMARKAEASLEGLSDSVDSS